mmetsp:Transcript_32785/g.103780  ORF Transcript_32785/g.103780 Transcript_32785/m.103780 type:complete len:358 (-) Transcript_32785:588-1661(-)
MLSATAPHGASSPSSTGSASSAQGAMRWKRTSPESRPHSCSSLTPSSARRAPSSSPSASSFASRSFKRSSSISPGRRDGEVFCWGTGSPRSLPTGRSAVSPTHCAMRSSSAPMRSALTLSRSARCTSGAAAASRSRGEKRKPSRAAKRTARSVRSGSSRSVVSGGSGVSMSPARKSAKPRPLKSSIRRVRRLKNKLLMVRSRRMASSNAVPMAMESGMRESVAYVSVRRFTKSRLKLSTLTFAVSRCLLRSGFCLTSATLSCSRRRCSTCAARCAANSMPNMLSMATSTSAVTANGFGSVGSRRRFPKSLSRTHPPATRSVELSCRSATTTLSSSTKRSSSAVSPRLNSTLTFSGTF